MSKQVMQKNDEIIQQNCEIKACKLEIKEHQTAMADIETHFKEIEIFADKNRNKTMELQNWIDVYMPLRFQYQLQETMKECLTRKGKFMLSVVSNEMCDQLRERLFNDVNNEEL